MRVIPAGFKPCARWKTYCNGVVPEGETKWCGRCLAAQRSRREKKRRLESHPRLQPSSNLCLCAKCVEEQPWRAELQKDLKKTRVPEGL